MSAQHSYIFEQGGVLLRVDYELEPELKFVSCRVLGADYKPCGPDLTSLLSGVLVMDGAAEAVRFLSLVAEEIHELVPPRIA